MNWIQSQKSIISLSLSLLLFLTSFTALLSTSFAFSNPPSTTTSTFEITETLNPRAQHLDSSRYYSRPSMAPLQATKQQGQEGKETMASSSTSNSSDGFRLGYVTDVEGNLDYFLSFVRQSNVLDIEEWNNKKLTLKLQGDECYFVFGGDSIDKGPGDIRLVRALVDLKRRYPERVYLLVGNRDLNKLRYTAELAKDDLERNLDDIPPPHWDLKAPSIKDYLTTLQQESKENSKETIESLNTRPNRLRYMLKHTLGCPKTFEFRREEISILQDRGMSDITDEEVVDNFIEEVTKGSLYDYFRCANVAVVIGNTLLCHGAVDRNTMQYIPADTTRFENPKSKAPPAKLATTVQEWVDDLNVYLERGLKDHEERPYWNDDRTSRGGEALMALQNRPAMWGRSIVSNCYGDGGCITTENAAQIRNDPERIIMEDSDALVFEKVSSDPMDPVVADWLKKYGIQRVIVGHKPTGDCPAVLSATYTGVEIVSADTSFSDTSAPDNRGAATSIVELVGDSRMDNQLQLTGSLRDGREYNSIFHRLHPGGVDETVGDGHLGKQLEDGWWIKASTSEGTYCLTRGKGRHVEYQYVNVGESILEALESSRR